MSLVGRFPRVQPQAQTLPGIPNLAEELWRLLRQVPVGRVTTYGDLAEALGDIAAARWVGELLLDHSHGAGCPCHRVVRRTGELGLHISRNQREKQAHLRADSVTVSRGRVDLGRFGFRDFKTHRPLEALSAFQKTLPQRVSLRPLAQMPHTVAGIDVSYVGPMQAVAAYVVFELNGDEPAWSMTVSREVAFPYIPGYLAFREAPVLLDLLQEVRSSGRLANLILVDGHGILHHRNAGIATHVGVTADVPTVGIGKKLLCGRLDPNGTNWDQSRPITYDGRLVGMAVQGHKKARPIFVSPGQHIDVADAVRITRLLFRRRHRLPEPLYLADRLSRRAAADQEDR